MDSQMDGHHLNLFDRFKIHCQKILLDIQEIKLARDSAISWTRGAQLKKRREATQEKE